MKLDDLASIHCDHIEILELDPEYFVAIPFPAPVDQAWEKLVDSNVTLEGVDKLCRDSMHNPELALACTTYLGVRNLPRGTGKTKHAAQENLLNFLSHVAPQDEALIVKGIKLMLSTWVIVCGVYDQMHRTGATFIIQELLLLADGIIEQRFPEQERARYQKYLDRWSDPIDVVKTPPADKSFGDVMRPLTPNDLSSYLNFRIVTFKDKLTWYSVLVLNIDPSQLKRHYDLDSDEIQIWKYLTTNTWKGYLARAYLTATWYPYGSGTTEMGSFSEALSRISKIPGLLAGDFANLVDMSYTGLLLSIKALKVEKIIDHVPADKVDDNELRRNIMRDAQNPHKWFTSHFNAVTEEYKDKQ